MRPSGKMGKVLAGEMGEIAVEGRMCRTVPRRTRQFVAPAEHPAETHQKRHEKNVRPLRLVHDVRHLEKLGQQRHVGAQITQVRETRELCVLARVLAEVGALCAEQQACPPLKVLDGLRVVCPRQLVHVKVELAAASEVLRARQRPRTWRQQSAEQLRVRSRQRHEKGLAKPG